MTDKNDRHWIQTYTGLKFHPMDGKAEDMSLEDIAHSLSLQCRFTGHCRVFYSVAEHCVRISRAVSPQNALWGLLHDATEAYMGDVSTPLKRQLPLYKEAENKLLEVVAKRFGLQLPMPQEIKDMDLRMLATEARDLHRDPPEPWWSLRNTKPLDECIEPWSANEAEYQFLERYKELQVFSIEDKSNRYKKAAEYLWQLLDDIDTLDDSCKDKNATFRHCTIGVAKKRQKIAVSTDGQTLVWKFENEDDSK